MTGADEPYPSARAVALWTAEHAPACTGRCSLGVKQKNKYHARRCSGVLQAYASTGDRTQGMRPCGMLGVCVAEQP